MPRYFFHRTDGFVDSDIDGTECENENAARIQAVIFAGESLRDKPKYVWKGREFRVEVTDAGGRLLFTIVTLSIDASASASPQIDEPDGLP